MDKFRFIDLFCGIGGFHAALKDLGGQCVFASDIDPACRKVYSDNWGLEPAGDITKVEASDIPPFDLLCGGFPCQSFSKAGNRRGIDDPRGTLFFDILRIAQHHKPKYMILENVRNLAGHDKGNTWRVIHHNLNLIGYHVSAEPIIFSPHYIGIPQHRERVFILCKRKDTGELPPFHFDRKKRKKTNPLEILQREEEIENIKKYKLSKGEENLINLWNEFIQGIRGNLPGFPVWSEWLREVEPSHNIDQYPAWKQNYIRKNSELYSANREFLDRWLGKAKTNPDFFGAKAKFEWQAGKTATPNIWDTLMHFRPSGLRVKALTHYPALVAITQTSIVGPLKRRLTPRECARLQSFPDTFRIHPNNRIAYKQLGNSVNVEVVRMFAKLLLSK